MKKALITGASGGIGLATAEQMANEGYALTLVARNVDKLEEITRRLAGHGHEYIAADLSNRDEIDKLASHIEATSYDVLINNAGAGIYGRFHEIALGKHMQMLRLNCDALLILSYAYLKNAKKGDALINVGSFLGSTSFSGASAYTGTKGFVVRFSESLWDEYRKDGIYVGVFSPGVTKSNFHKAANGSEGDFPTIIQQTPEACARELVRAIRKRNKPHYVSGFMTRSMLTFFRLLPRKEIVKAMGANNPVKT